MRRLALFKDDSELSIDHVLQGRAIRAGEILLQKVAHEHMRGRCIGDWEGGKTKEIGC